MTGKFFSILIALFMSISLVACGSSEGSDDPREGAVNSSASEVASDDSSEDDSLQSSNSENDSSLKKPEDSSKSDTSSAETVTTTKTTAITTTAKTETSFSVTTTSQRSAAASGKVTTAARPAQAQKTTAKHTHNWVKQWDDGLGTIAYWCPICFQDKYEHYTPKTTSAAKTTQPAKSSHKHNWVPIYKMSGKSYYRCHCGWMNPTAYNPNVSNTPENIKAGDEMDAHQDTCIGFTDGHITFSSGYSNTGFAYYKGNIIAFYYCKDCMKICSPDKDDAMQEAGQKTGPDESVIHDKIPSWWYWTVNGEKLCGAFFWVKDTPFEKEFDPSMYYENTGKIPLKYAKHDGQWCVISKDSFF